MTFVYMTKREFEVFSPLYYEMSYYKYKKNMETKEEWEMERLKEKKHE